MNANEQNFEELNLEDILKEFGSGELLDGEAEASHEMGDLDHILAQPLEEPPAEAPQSPAPAADEAAEPEHLDAADGLNLDEPDSAETPDGLETSDKPDAADEPNAEDEPDRAEEPDPAEDMPAEPENAAADTIRLDDISQASGPDTKKDAALPEETEDKAEFDTAEEELPPPQPIVFRPRSRLQELKRQLIAGPEKRYYELTEVGVGKLQIAILLCLLVVLFSGGCAAAYHAGLIPETRLRLMAFCQVLAMLFGGLLGSYQMMEGLGDLFHGKFTMNTLLAFTFAACFADGFFCLMEERIPICAAFTLEVAMSLWATYHRRVTEMGQMDTMRKAVRLDSVVLTKEFHEGKPGFLRGEGQVADFMDRAAETTTPEKVQNLCALLSLCASVAVAVLGGVMHSTSMGVQLLSTTLLVAVPASCFVALTRPMAVLERKLHSLGTVLCGWQGVKGLCSKGAYPLTDTDIFPAGSSKMNGVKFYGDRDPEETISYATALMHANGGSLAPIFDQLLASRNGIKYEAGNLQYYGNGGIGGEICGEPVLMGSLDFLKEMGVEIPEGVMVKQAVYVSIDGELSGLFAITYNRSKYSAVGLAALCTNRRVTPVVIAEDFMLTDGFLKEKFGINTRRMAFPSRADREALAEKKAGSEDAALALTTQEGLAPAAYAISAARSLRTAWKLGLAIQMLGGVLGVLIMAALAFLGATELLTPVHVLLYQLVWALPSLLVTFWTKMI